MTLPLSDNFFILPQLLKKKKKNRAEITSKTRANVLRALKRGPLSDFDNVKDLENFFEELKKCTCVFFFSFFFPIIC